MQNVFHSHFPSRCLFVVAALFYSFVTQLSAQNVSCSVANKVYVAPGQQGQARVLLNSWDRKSVVDRVGYALTIDGVTGQERILELKKPLTYDEAAQMTIEVPPAAHPGVDDFSVTILTVNGKPNRNSFPTSGSQRYTLTRPVFRKAVVEDLTAMWCQNCPRGIASLEHLNHVAADRYIGLAAHDGDALGTGDYYEVFRLFPGRPKIVLNGSHNVPPYFGNSGTTSSRLVCSPTCNRPPVRKAPCSSWYKLPGVPTAKAWTCAVPPFIVVRWRKTNIDWPMC